MQVHPRSNNIKAMIRTGGTLHPDFGGGEKINGHFVPYGIPFITVDSSTGSPPLRPIDVVAYVDESDAGLYPFPADAPVEGAYAGCPESVCGGDRHVLVVVS